MTAPVTYRDLTTLPELAAVVELERRVWGPGYEEVVPVPILAVTVKRGGILMGAFEDERMIGFVYSLPAVKNGKPTQWSHMLGVVEEHRRAGVGHRLKLLQRERALSTGFDLIEWTYDPLQALNAHLNFGKLGVIVLEYQENIYGESSSPLHKGNPTDRFVAEWRVRDPHVERRLKGSPGLPLGPGEIAGAPSANQTQTAGGWLVCGDIDLSLETPWVVVSIPVGFSEMLVRAPDLALAWRMATRRIFTTYFTREYHAVEVCLDLENRKGTYQLKRRM